MTLMRTAKAVLAAFVSASLALPASAQVRAAASVAGSAFPRVPLPALLAPAAAASTAAPFLNFPAASVNSPALLSAPSAPVSLPALAALDAAGAAAPISIAVPAEARPAAALRTQASALLEGHPSAAASVRSRWENFWSRSSTRDESETEFDASGAASAAKLSAPAPLSRRYAREAPPSRLAAAAVLIPAAQHVHAFVAHASPFLGAGAVLLGAYAANRGVHALLSRFAAKKGMDRHQIAAVRLVTNVALWTGAVAAALMVGGASQSMMTTVLGAGGTILPLGLRDVLGNVIQGVSFLITRPFAIGARVQIEDEVGTVADATLTAVVIKKDDGSEVKIRHAALAAKPVIVFGAYAPEGKLHLAVPMKPKFKGALGAVLKALDRRFWLAGASFGALLAAPAFAPFLAAGWAATALHYALGGSIAWLTRRGALALNAAVDHVARENSWRKETTALARLGLSAALWAFGGGAALRLFGVSWTALVASFGLTTLGIGLASNNFVGSVVQGGEVLLSKPFKVGDRISIGTLSGLVADMTLYHVVLKLDEGRHALVPYAVVRDAAIVVTPGK